MGGKAPTDLLFASSAGGRLDHRRERPAWFDRAAASIGFDELTPHELRHTAASLAVSVRANVKAVQRMLGHASAAMTLDTYADLFDDDLDDVGERLDTLAHSHAARGGEKPPAPASIRNLVPATLDEPRRVETS